MSKIEISTTQNVSIEYELASLSERIFAFIVDQIILWVTVLILTAIFVPAGGFFYNLVTFILILPIFVFYSLFSEIFLNGQSLGKRVFGIKVVKLSGDEPGLNDYIIRWTFRMIDIWFSFGTVASLLIGSSSKRQRLGDLVANTAIIKIKSSFHLKLKDILKINSLENYEITYPAVRQFSEQDMLLIKTVLARVQRFPNRAHKEALYDLVTKVTKKMGIENRPKNSTQFLKTLIRDYIVLTR
ncbi:MAG: RDD family protein [Bacteroidota bacterium]